MTIFDFVDYKQFVRQKLKTFPRGGHGQYLKIARLLDIHTTMVSHIFKGEAHLSVENALKLAEYFVLNELETEYFVTLVHLDRAANPQSKRYFTKQLETLKARALNLTERLQVKKSLSESDQAIFYSAWYYSAIRLLTAVEEFRSTEAISERMDLPHPTVVRAMEFLLTTGLVEQNAKGVYCVGTTLTYVSRDSRLVGKHHLNWRLKAIEQLDFIPVEDLVFTNSIALSHADFLKIREELVKFLETYKKIGDPSPSEQLSYLTIDWRTLPLK